MGEGEESAPSPSHTVKPGNVGGEHTEPNALCRVDKSPHAGSIFYGEFSAHPRKEDVMRKALVLFTTAALVAGSALAGPALARDRMDRSELSANQITDQYAARTARIKADLRLTPEQAKNWPGFESTMNDLAKASADRQMAMQTTGTQPKGPVDIIEQMRRQAKYMSERSVERKTIADAAEPLYASLDDQQKRRFAAELINLSRPDAD
jgi:hypothetical protein